MPVTPTSPAPYAPSRAVLDIIGRYRDRGLPSPISMDVLQRAGVSESLIPRTIQTLKTLDLIDEDGRPTVTFEGLRLASEADFRVRMTEWLNGAYADVLNFVDPASADETSLRDAFRSYTPVGQQPRMVSLFTGLYTAAGVGPERATNTRSPRTRPKPNSNGSGGGAPTKPRTSTPAGDRAPTPTPPNEAERIQGISDKALEYKLVDLLKDPEVGESERSAIWTLIQYIAGARKKGAGNQS